MSTAMRLFAATDPPRQPLSPKAVADLLHLLMPTPVVPGFDLCSPRCLQVWNALFFHASKHGKWCCPDALPDDERYAELKCIRATGLAAFWSVDQVARMCGVDARTVGRLLAEMRDLGWIRYCSRTHDENGQFCGMLFVLTIPPTTLTTAAQHRYREEIAQQKQKLDVKAKRVDAGLPPCERDTDADAPNPVKIFHADSSE
jgi:hypothetical protein